MTSMSTLGQVTGNMNSRLADTPVIVDTDAKTGITTIWPMTGPLRNITR